MNVCIFTFVVIVVCCGVLGWITNDLNKFWNPDVGITLCLLGLIIGTIVLFATINIMDQKGAMVEDSHRYYIGAELYGITKDNIYLFIDENDNIWEWEDDKEYTYDKVYLLSMDINNTYNVRTDDILLMVWQEGG